MTELRPLLEEFAEIAENWYSERKFVVQDYEFIQAFFQLENLQQADWEDFQELGRKIHALKSNDIALANAFGEPNHPIERYRKSFKYLAHGEASLPERLDQVSSNEEPYGIKYLSESSIGELAGKLFAKNYLVYNQRSRKGLEHLGYEVSTQGLSFGERFVHLTEAARPVVDAYDEVVGPRTNVPIHLEVDQFFSWIFETHLDELNDQRVAGKVRSERPENVWLIGARKGRRSWSYWLDQQIISLGWDRTGHLLDYDSQEEIESSGRAVSFVDAKAAWEFSRVMKKGDLVFVKARKNKILGVGLVASDYRFAPEAKYSNTHQRKIQFIETGEWKTLPRSFPRLRWDRDKKESDDWRDEPRVLPSKTLTEIGKYDRMTAELEILLGIGGQIEAGYRDPLPIDEALLETAVEQEIRPRVNNKIFREGRESYLHDQRIPSGQRHLLPEALGEDPIAHAKKALPTDGSNPLGWQEVDRAKNAFEVAGAEELRGRLGDLLRGEDSLLDRLEAFLEWGRFEGKGETVEINGTVASYLLAVVHPPLCAFCKPSTYKAAAEALLGPNAALTASDEADRILHASRFYGEVLRLLRRKYELPLRDLWDVHAAFYILSDTSDNHYPEASWDHISELAMSATEDADSNYFWLNYNPDGEWDPRNEPSGQSMRFTAQNEEGNSRKYQKNYEKAKPGDRVVAYATNPKMQIVSLLQVEEGLHSAGDGRDQIMLEKVEDLRGGPKRQDLLDDSDLSNLNPLHVPGGSLFEISEQDFNAILDPSGSGRESFSVEEATKDLFYEKEKFEDWLDRLRKKKNIILQGPPGVGKTFVSKKLAYALLEERDKRRVEMVQLHQSYTYEDFIRGYRPQPDRSFQLQDGVFFKFCQKAIDDPKRDYVFIIDEINRGNLSKVFGELMMLIEKDKRGPSNRVPLAYQREENEKFYVPDNLYLIGMMNTADRSLAMVDYALRRRFAFIEMGPKFESEGFRNLLQERGADQKLVNKVRTRLRSLNDEIEDDSNLGEGFKIGHSYFCPDEGETADEEWYEKVIDREIWPLLKEYWFDDREKAEDEVDMLKE